MTVEKVACSALAVRAISAYCKLEMHTQISRGSLHSAAQDLVYKLVAFSISHGVNLANKAAITAVDFVGVDANDWACIDVSAPMSIGATS